MAHEGLFEVCQEAFEEELLGAMEVAGAKCRKLFLSVVGRLDLHGQIRHGQQ